MAIDVPTQQRTRTAQSPDGFDPVAAAIEGSGDYPSRRPSALHHLPELDGLRGLAAFAVFVHHLCYASIHAEGQTPVILAMRTLAIPGAYGVDLFFVLSGFLITSLLHDARTRPAYYHDFYWKRALRVLPLYAIVLLYVLATIPGSGGYVLLSALFLANFAAVFHVAATGPFWTLAIEEQFYLLWPAVLRRSSIAQLRRVALGLALACIALRIGGALIGHHNFYYTFVHCDGLAAGAWIAFWFRHRQQSQSVSPREPQALASILLLGLLLIVPSLFRAFHARHLPVLDALALTGVTLLCAFLIAYAITRTGQRRLAPLRSRVLTFFGLISYALYMTHLYVMQAYDHYHPLAPGELPPYLARFTIVLAITISLCLLSRYLIELPANSLRRYVLARPITSSPEYPLAALPLDSSANPTRSRR